MEKNNLIILFHNHKSVKYYTGSVPWDIFCHKINCLSVKLKSWLFNLNFRENKVQNKDQIWKFVNLDFTIYRAICFTHEKHQRFEGWKVVLP